MPTLRIRSEVNRTYKYAVQLHRTNTYFIDHVSDFIASGFRRDEARLIITTRQNRDAIQKKLNEKLGGYAGGTLFEHAKCTFIEAENILERIHIDGWPNEKKFYEVFGSILAQMKQTGNAPIHIFGETVALLCAEGKSDAAIVLETLWDKLAAAYAFSFPCGSLFNTSTSEGSSKAINAIYNFPFDKNEIKHDSITLSRENGNQALQKLRQITSAELESEIKLRRTLEQALIESNRQLAEQSAALADAHERLQDEVNRRKEIEKDFAHLQKVQDITQKISHLGSWEADPKTSVLTCSDEFYRICGLEPQSQVIDFAFTQSIIHPDDQEASSNATQATIDSNEPYIIEKRIIRPDGSIRHVISQGEVIFNASQEVETIIGSYLDISDLKQAEENLRRSHEELRKLAAHQEKIKEKEQRRIAQELHDELGGLLTGLKAYITTAIENIKPDTRKASNLLLEAVNIADIALDSTRRIVNDLHPNVLDNLGLWAALKWYGERITHGKNLICGFFIDESAQAVLLNLEQSTMLFRICQEALTNIMRHSKATHINISASCHMELLTIKIEDNGIGFNTGHLDNCESMGISGMHERARCLGGEINITSLTGKGTTVQLSLPLDQVLHAVE